MYKVIATGSTGNAVLYFGSILVDCGVPYSKLKPYINDIQLVLLTHEHGDHFIRSTVERLTESRPTLRIGCGPWMKDLVKGIKNVDFYQIGEVYDYGIFQITAVKLYHDVPNCGYRIFKDGFKVLHATDTAHLQGVAAKGYDLYAVEHNYDADTIDEAIAAKQAAGEYAYQKGAVNSHLSEQQASEFIYRNRSANSQTLRLHEHNNSL